MGARHFLRILNSVALMTARLHMRRARTWIMAALILSPCLLPALVAYYGPERGMPPEKLFVALFDFLFVYTLVPLTALFYACALLAEEIEGHTFPLLLSRPAPRGAFVLGKYVAFVCVSTALVTVSLGVTFYASVLFLKLPPTGAHHAVLARYAGLCTAGLAAYGALCLAISTLTRRPVLVAALFIFGWEKMVVAIPGYADFLTLQKYLGRLLPEVAFRRIEIAKVELPVELMREVYPVTTGVAVVTLAALTIALLTVACVAVRVRQYATGGEAA
jgi:ABC-type transport system involved in multi-copper enzyme maturation permease subunit